MLTICLALLVVVLTFLLYCIFIPSLRTYTMVNKIHGPGGLPLIGVALTVNKLQFCEILEYFRKCTIEYPRLTLLWLLGIPMVFMTEPEDIAEVLGSTVNLEKGVEYQPVKPWLNEGLLLSTGDKWHYRRKLLTPTFHFKILEENLMSMQKHAQYLVKKLLQDAGKAVDIQEIIPLCTLDVMCETAMGIQLGALDNPSSDYVKCIKKVGALTLFRMQNLYLRRDWIFNLTSRGKEFNKYLKQLHDFTIKIIRERKAEFKEAKKNKIDVVHEDDVMTKKRKAFLDLLLELDTDNKLSEKDIREEVDTFLFEGHDTTAAAITFSIFVLGAHPDIQAKVVEEIDSVLQGQEEPITKKQLNDMKYLDKVIKEVLRIYPSVPYISRELDHDVRLKGDVVLPAGTNTVISPYILHRRPELFPEPEKFDPERFSPENSTDRHPYAYVPFSAGPKNCIGQKFALMEIKVVLVSLLSRVHIESLTKEKDVKCSPLLILRSDTPLMVKITPRKL